MLKTPGRCAACVAVLAMLAVLASSVSAELVTTSAARNCTDASMHKLIMPALSSNQTVSSLSVAVDTVRDGREGAGTSLPCEADESKVGTMDAWYTLQPSTDGTCYFWSDDVWASVSLAGVVSCPPVDEEYGVVLGCLDASSPETAPLERHTNATYRWSEFFTQTGHDKFGDLLVHVRGVGTLNIVCVKGGFCGDGVTDRSEQCDPGILHTKGSCCTSQCMYREPGETCHADGDGCTADSCDAEGVCLPGTCDSIEVPDSGDASTVVATPGVYRFHVPHDAPAVFYQDRTLMVSVGPQDSNADLRFHVTLGVHDKDREAASPGHAWPRMDNPDGGCIPEKYIHSHRCNAMMTACQHVSPDTRTDVWVNVFSDPPDGEPVTVTVSATWVQLDVQPLVLGHQYTLDIPTGGVRVFQYDVSQADELAGKYINVVAQAAGDVDGDGDDDHEHERHFDVFLYDTSVQKPSSCVALNALHCLHSTHCDVSACPAEAGTHRLYVYPSYLGVSVNLTVVHEAPGVEIVPAIADFDAPIQETVEVGAGEPAHHRYDLFTLRHKLTSRGPPHHWFVPRVTISDIQYHGDVDVLSFDTWQYDAHAVRRFNGLGDPFCPKHFSDSEHSDGRTGRAVKPFMEHAMRCHGPGPCSSLDFIMACQVTASTFPYLLGPDGDELALYAGVGLGDTNLNTTAASNASFSLTWDVVFAQDGVPLTMMPDSDDGVTRWFSSASSSAMHDFAFHSLHVGCHKSASFQFHRDVAVQQVPVVMSHTELWRACHHWFGRGHGRSPFLAADGHDDHSTTIQLVNRHRGGEHALPYGHGYDVFMYTKHDEPGHAWNVTATVGLDNCQVPSVTGMPEFPEVCRKHVDYPIFVPGTDMQDVGKKLVAGRLVLIGASEIWIDTEEYPLCLDMAEAMMCHVAFPSCDADGFELPYCSSRCAILYDVCPHSVAHAAYRIVPECSVPTTHLCSPHHASATDACDQPEYSAAVADMWAGGNDQPAGLVKLVQVNNATAVTSEWRNLEPGAEYKVEAVQLATARSGGQYIPDFPNIQANVDATDLKLLTDFNGAFVFTAAADGTAKFTGEFSSEFGHGGDGASLHGWRHSHSLLGRSLVLNKVTGSTLTPASYGTVAIAAATRGLLPVDSNRARAHDASIAGCDLWPAMDQADLRFGTAEATAAFSMYQGHNDTLFQLQIHFNDDASTDERPDYYIVLIHEHGDIMSGDLGDVWAPYGMPGLAEHPRHFALHKAGEVAYFRHHGRAGHSQTMNRVLHNVALVGHYNLIGRTISVAAVPHHDPASPAEPILLAHGVIGVVDTIRHHAVCGNGLHEPGEVCDGHACCNSECQIHPPSHQCRADDENSCARSEHCPGWSNRFSHGAFCPRAQPKLQQTGCGPTQLDDCEAARAECDGTSLECPNPTPREVGWECRPADPLVPCDVPEYCDGASGACPAEEVTPCDQDAGPREPAAAQTTSASVALGLMLVATLAVLGYTCTSLTGSKTAPALVPGSATPMTTMSPGTPPGPEQFHPGAMAASPVAEGAPAPSPGAGAAGGAAAEPAVLETGRQDDGFDAVPIPQQQQPPQP